MATGLPERFLSKVEKEPDGCWVWTGARGANGYGRFWWHGTSAIAHRIAYALLVGPVPLGLDLDHLCRNRACVNPEHLEPVTRLENLKRGNGHGTSSTCPQGHPYSGDNLYIEKTNGSRRCRTCNRLRQRARRAAAS